jgi:hypothetical protein
MIMETLAENIYQETSAQASHLVLWRPGITQANEQEADLLMRIICPPKPTRQLISVNLHDVVYWSQYSVRHRGGAGCAPGERL